MSKDQFELVSPFQPTGDQPEAIDALVKSIETGNRMQTLKGVTAVEDLYHGQYHPAHQPSHAGAGPQ